MDKYTKYARIAPSVAAMIIPALIVVEFLTVLDFEVIELRSKAWTYVFNFIPTAILFSAIGYFAREIFRSVSKWIFQFALFREDQTEMPTTKMLLWSTKMMSISQKKKIREKIKAELKLNLLNEAEEREDLQEAKMTIVDAVASIRNLTREDKILLQYNCEFGFCRNYLGASIFALLFIALSAVVNIFIPFVGWIWIIGFFIFQIIIDVILFCSLKHRARDYAKQLFTAFLTL